MTRKDTIWDDIETTPTKLKLNIFKGIYNDCKTPNPIINFFIFAFLYWLEERYIEYKAKVAVDDAIQQYHKEMDAVETDWLTGAVITETKSPTSELLPEMRINNPNIKYD